MQVCSEFSKYAKEYSTYNIIQNKVIDKLLSKVKWQPKHILDLGCGSGSLVQKIEWEYKSFTGVDFAEGMLKLHPRSESIQCFHADFNDTSLFERLKGESYDIVFSASALQWAKDLEETFKYIAKLETKVAFAIFTANTFKTLHKTALLPPLLRSKEEISLLARKYFNATLELVEYTLEFEEKQEMFRYIKKSGVSGSRSVLSYKQTKELIRTYPLNYLEFEVLFIVSE